MNKRNYRSLASGLLLILLFAFLFILPSFDLTNRKDVYSVLLTLIIISSVLSLKRLNNKVLFFVIGLLIIHWISNIFSLPVLTILSKSLRILFFIMIVLLMAHQVATSKKVNAGTILESVSSYLLIGVMFSVMVSLLESVHPGSFTFPETATRPGDFTYFTFVTMTTLGYGDITPTTPLSRSLSILISVTGQIYIAVVIAMLIGKFSSRN